MAGPTLDAAGLHLQDLPTIRGEWAEALRTKTGIATLGGEDDNTELGEALGVWSERELLLQELMQQVLWARSVLQSTGQQLDDAVKFRGMFRNRATNTEVVLTVANPAPAGPDFTVPAGALIELIATGDRFTAQAATPVADSGSAAVTFRCIVTGPVQVPITATSGWRWISSFTGSTELTLTNPAIGVAGSNRETDAELKVRFLKSPQNASVGTVGAVLAAVLAVAGVTECTVYENDTDVLGITVPELIGSLPRHSICVVHRGGTDALVAQAILNKKTGGNQAWGSTTTTLPDSQGINKAIGHTPALPTTATIVVTLTGASATYAAAVKASLVAYGAELRSGDDVLLWKINALSAEAAPGTTNVSATINGVAASLAIAYDHYGDIQTAGITVNFV